MFAACEFWSAQLGTGEEEFDAGGLCVCNVDNAPDGRGGLVGWGCVVCARFWVAFWKKL